MKQGKKYKIVLPDSSEMVFIASHVEETKFELTSIKTGQKLVGLEIS